ncbi:DNA (cytosine-5-)-methyltransferase [Odoribacter laneus]|uniref:DNA (cytosine-5-)-methyltransferase n=1 Tax=Odoribacter laneus TaxID=626933 RepID=UPI00399414B1
MFRFIDLFAGIGGFHIAMHKAGGQCVFASEWDKYARITYEANFKKISPELFSSGNFNGDINDADPADIPDFDVLCAGFPCQPFSIAGLRKGFEDTRGTLFFNIANIVHFKKFEQHHAPKVLLLENVKGLKNHNKGNTFRKILATLDELGYNHQEMILNAKNFGVPQNRERLFIVAWDKDQLEDKKFCFPVGLDEQNNPIYNPEELITKVRKTHLGDILEEYTEEKYTISDRLYAGHLRRKELHKAKGNGFGFSLFNRESPYTSTISARYYKDGSEIMIEQEGINPRKLTPREAGRLQGYPIGKGYEIVVSDVQAYKQFGNSVAIPVVSTLAQEIVNQLLN